MNFLSTIFFGVDRQGFLPGVQSAIDGISHQDGIFTGDNLITFNRNLGFFEDRKFVDAWRTHAANGVEEAIVWRSAVLAWAARSVLARGIAGDFVECGCYKGTTARMLCDYTDFATLDRQYYLYDLFEHDTSMPHHAMPEHGPSLHERVIERFAGLDNVNIVRGRIPEVLHEVGPNRIAFMHIDLNNAPAEVGALEVLFERMSPGAILILDDYGWKAYRAQKLAEDPWMAERGYQILELPTGQGLLIK